MYQSKELLVASVAGMEAVAEAMNNAMSVRSMIQMFGNAQLVAMHKNIVELPAYSVITASGTGRAHDIGAGGSRKGKRKGSKLASGAKAKICFVVAPYSR